MRQDLRSSKCHLQLVSNMDQNFICGLFDKNKQIIRIVVC